MVLCFQGTMFPNAKVLSSQIPKFPGSYGPRFYGPMFLKPCVPRVLCSQGPKLPGLGLDLHYWVSLSVLSKIIKIDITWWLMCVCRKLTEGTSGSRNKGTFSMCQYKHWPKTQCVSAPDSMRMMELGPAICDETWLNYRARNHVYDMTWQMVGNSKHMFRFGSAKIPSVCVSLREPTWRSSNNNNNKTVWKTFPSCRVVNRATASGFDDNHQVDFGSSIPSHPSWCENKVCQRSVSWCCSSA